MHQVFEFFTSMIRKVILTPTRRYSSPTIYALSTHLARSAIGVVRVSGSQSGYIYDQLVNKNLERTESDKRLPLLHDKQIGLTPRLASVRKLYKPNTKLLLDEALVIYFANPKSFTGEDSLELHLHGGVAVIKSVLKAIKGLHDPNQGIYIRYAENGEFSKKAFLNNRLDLTQIEGIREMIDAETETQRIAAISSILGTTKSLFNNWRNEIINQVAMLAAVIDFGEDHDIEEVEHLFEQVQKKINTLTDEIQTYLYKVRKSEVLLKGIKLVLLGPPNAGKSLLLNLLADTDAAIVSDIAGTTRDVIDIPIDIGGYKVVLGDTAGIRETSTADTIEIEGIRRAKLKSLGSDLVVIVLSAGENIDYKDLFKHLEGLRENNKKIKLVLNKVDLLGEDTESLKVKLHALQREYGEKLQIPLDDIHLVSCLNQSGIQTLSNSLVESFKSISFSESADPVIISTRIQDLLENDVLEGFAEFNRWKSQDDVVLASESLRQSIEGIGKITGDAIGLEEILDVVFSSFCIGK